MYDVVIIGGGPSGSTLAKLLDKNYKILLLDRRNLGNPYLGRGFIKCCGGPLAPDAQHMLAKLGLGVPRQVLTGPNCLQ